MLSPSSLEFEFDAKRLDRTGYEVLKTERDVLIGELRGLGVNIMDWEPDMLLSTASQEREDSEVRSWQQKRLETPLTCTRARPFGPLLPAGKAGRKCRYRHGNSQGRHP